jgi:hypothetical protein
MARLQRPDLVPGMRPFLRRDSPITILKKLVILGIKKLPSPFNAAQTLALPLKPETFTLKKLRGRPVIHIRTSGHSDRELNAEGRRDRPAPFGQQDPVARLSESDKTEESSPKTEGSLRSPVQSRANKVFVIDRKAAAAVRRIEGRASSRKRRLISLQCNL